MSIEDDRWLGSTNMNVYLLKSIGNLPKPDSRPIKLGRKEQIPEPSFAHHSTGSVSL